jgi:hypothetical protein
MRPDVFELCVLQNLTQLRHRHTVPGADVDPAQEDDLRRHEAAVFTSGTYLAYPSEPVSARGLAATATAGV